MSASEPIHQFFTVGAEPRLVVRNIRGHVSITPGETGRIEIHALVDPASGSPDLTHVELSQDADGCVHAVVRYPENSISWIFGRQPCEVDLTIQAPAHCHLDVHGVSNDVTASGFDGKFTFKTVSGDLSLRSLQGDMRLTTVSGDCLAEGLSGALNLDTVSGDVCLTSSNLASIQANTVSGDLEFQTALGEGPYSCSSVSGDVRLHLPPETHCQAELHSISGDLACAFPAACAASHGSRTVILQGGGVLVQAKSVSGDLALTCDGPLPASPTRKELLEKLERGELNAEQVLHQLRS